MQLLTAGLFKYVWLFVTTRYEKVKAVYFSFAYDLFGNAVYIDSCSVLVQIQFMFHNDKNIFVNEQKKNVSKLLLRSFRKYKRQCNLLVYDMYVKSTKHKDLITNQNEDNYLAICGFIKQI